MSLRQRASAVFRRLCDVLGCETPTERQQSCQAARTKKNFMQWAQAATNSSRGSPPTWTRGRWPALSTSRRSTQPGALVKIVGMILRRQPRIDRLSMGPCMEHDCRDAATTCINAYAPTPGNVKNGGFATGRAHLLYLLTLRTRRRATFTLFFD